MEELMFINGIWKEAGGGKFFDVLDPATGEEIGQVPDGGREDAVAAVDAATHAFQSWSKQTAYSKAEFLYEAHRLMMENLEHLAGVMTREMGKPIRASRNEVRYAADFLLWFAEETKRVYGRSIPSARSDQRFWVQHQPVGVVAAITPWNYPVSMITRKAAPALAAGCTFILKPAEATPMCAVETFKIFEKAGFPPGVVNLVTALDPAPIGEVFLTDPRVRKLTFTGSTEIGKMIASRAADQMKRISLELGGHAPFIVCPDADPVHAAKGLSLVKFLNTGQACISPNRIYVHCDQLKPFIGELEKRVSRMKAGIGMNSDVSIGPLVDKAAVKKVDDQVQDALSKGAELVAGGRRLTENGLDKGHFYAPTILSRVTPEMRIYREETFGPVAPVVVYDDEARVLDMANDTHYGLAAYVYTQQLATAIRYFEGLHFGIIGINDINPTSAAAPFGGMKQSGIGREGASEGIFEYLETKLGGFSVPSV
jgi:succinate-semialdehyde dehydrogenase/glutarate-semialdehyde dehydrogenase